MIIERHTDNIPSKTQSKHSEEEGESLSAVMLSRLLVRTEASSSTKPSKLPSLAPVPPLRIAKRIKPRMGPTPDTRLEGNNTEARPVLPLMRPAYRVSAVQPASRLVPGGRGGSTSSTTTTNKSDDGDAQRLKTIGTGHRASTEAVKSSVPRGQGVISLGGSGARRVPITESRMGSTRRKEESRVIGGGGGGLTKYARPGGGAIGSIPRPGSRLPTQGGRRW